MDGNEKKYLKKEYKMKKKCNSKLFSKKRDRGNGVYEEDDTEDYYRSSFHKDYDRIIFSNSFRRLSKKTQVHPLSKNDHVHNRLTHSLEVASVGRSLGLKAVEFLNKKIKMDINPYDIAYIIQTACLAHDIGNPPFGHAGEEVIKEWFKKNEEKDFLKKLSEEEKKDFQHFDGNAQSFRIVSKLENSLNKGGMRLTFATLGTLVKYPYTSTQCDQSKSKFNFFQSEKDFVEFLFTNLGLKQDDDSYRRHPLSYLMEASDDICYGLLDLQDAVELKILKLEDTKEIFTLLCGDDKTNKTYNDDSMNVINKISKLVAISINNLTRHVMKIFENNFEIICGYNQPKDLIELFEDNNLKEGLKNAKKLAQKKIFNEKRKIELELGAYCIIETLLDSLIQATYQLNKVNSVDKLDFRSKRIIELMGKDAPNIDDSLYKQYQSIIDYIVGMTDNYAKYISHQLNGMSY